MSLPADGQAPYPALRQKMDRGETVLLDGGVGTELVRRGVRWRGHGLQTDADAVRTVHEDYLRAGADVIRTNTFQLNPRTYLNVFHNLEHMRHIGAPGLERRALELAERAVQLAREARERTGRMEVAIAGVMSPLEHCFRPDLAPHGPEAAAEHGEMAGILVGAGADLLLIESMNTIAEAQAAALSAGALGVPAWVSFVVDGSGQLLDGEPMLDAAEAMYRLGVEVVLANCAPPEAVSDGIARLSSASGRWFGGYAHIGKFDPPSWKFEFFPQFNEVETWPPERYTQSALEWRARGARVLGGCCGTGPAHIQALRTALDGVP